MNTKPSPSRYRNCISRRSTMARPTLTPALNVRSTTAPVRTFRSLVRTKAPPLPGFTCWNSITWNRVPSSSSVMPFLRSLVETLTRVPRRMLACKCRGRPPTPSRGGHEQVPGGSREHARRPFGHLDHVLDADPAQAGEVDTRLYGDHRPRRKRLPVAPAQARALVA